MMVCGVRIEACCPLRGNWHCIEKEFEKDVPILKLQMWIVFKRPLPLG
jgi:hypothetical protein